MRIHPDFILREVAGESILIPVGEASRHLSGLIALNGSGKLLYVLLQTERSEEELVRAILDTYEVDAETAAADVAEFLGLLRENRMLIEDAT